MISQTKFEKAFSTPIVRFQVDDHAALDAELKREGVRLREEDEGVSKSNRGGWHSKGNLFADPAPSIRNLKTAAEEAVFAATRKLTSKVEPETFRLKLFAWMNINPPGGFNAPHTHPGAHWSGVYYVSQPDIQSGSCGMIVFL